MGFCLIACGLALLPAAAVSAPPEKPKAASVVRADPRTGRLVRDVRLSPSAAPVVRKYARETAERHQVDPELVDALIGAESSFNPLAVSRKGAQGVMQLMPATARRFDVNDAFDPWQNIEGGVRYLKYLLTLFGDQDPTNAVAAYNAGEGAVARHGGVPPYPETERYVRKIGRKLGEAKRSPAAAAARPAEPAPPVVEQYTDAAGVWHLRTRPSP